MFQRAASMAGLIAMSLAVWSCGPKPTTQSTTNNQATPTVKPQAEAARPPVESGGLRVGEASGSYTAKGENVTLRYAYAGRGQRFGSDSVIILLTDKEIPPAALAEELNSQTMLLDGKLRGLEYAIAKDGYWVRYHPGQYQESKSSSLKDYVIENDVVRGTDEDKGDLTDGRYSRSVKFVAAISK